MPILKERKEVVKERGLGKKSLEQLIDGIEKTENYSGSYRDHGVNPIQEGMQTRHGTTQVAQLLGVHSSTIIKELEQHPGFIVPRAEKGAVPKREFMTAHLYELAHLRRKKSKKALQDPVIMATYLEKGGVGKSVITREFASSFPLLGYRTLVIDLDPGASLSKLMGYDNEITEKFAKDTGFPMEQVVKYTFGNVVAENAGFRNLPKATLKEAIKKPFGEYGPHLIPSGRGILDTETSFRHSPISAKIIKQWLETGFMEPSEDFDLREYDIILFDCASDTSCVTQAALIGSDFMISPVKLEGLSLSGFEETLKFLQVIEAFKETIPTPIVVGNFYKKKSTSCEYQLGRLRSLTAGHNIFIDPVIRESELFNKGFEQDDQVKIPVFLRKPSDPVAKDILKLSNSIIEHIAQYY